MLHPTPQSEWKPISLTISDEVATALRVCAALTGEEVGPVVDMILRASLEPILQPVNSLKGSLQLHPIAVHCELSSGDVLRGEVLSLRIADAGKAIRDVSVNPPEPTTSSEYEARFLEEVLIFARTLVNWDAFLEQLETDNSLSRSPLILAETPEKEVRSWLKAGRVPARWKAWVFNQFQLPDRITFSIFKERLAPDDFFEWEQPGESIWDASEPVSAT